ncbi:MAG: Ppx/GppA family phosphatase, partial [Proteobacteria bacterium]|nr:Ppx/GppA family phosphatase [Pseudomonadota bacterium]
MPGTDGRVSVIDIGSNSVRLVVFEGLVRAPLPIFNEKILAGLGSGLATSGLLDAEGMERALAAIERFVAVSRALGAGLPEIVATAAVRDAQNGKDFVVAAEQRAGGRVRVLRGREEARFSALGVVASFPGADGLVADLGGGSLEFMLVDSGVLGEGFTLPLGPLRLIGESSAMAKEIVDAAFARIDWLWKQTRGRNLYAVGGAWRNFARVDMARGQQVLHVVHHYAMDRDRVLSLAELLSGLTDRSMKGIAGISRRRQAALPMAAMVLGRTVAISGASRVVFSGAGLREGVVHDRLPADEAARDPLLAAAARMAERAGRAGENG